MQVQEWDEMDYKTITITFPRELTVDEERILISEFQGIITGIEKGIRGAMNIPFIGKPQKETYTNLLNNILEYVRLEKPEANAYRLSIAVENINAFNLQLPGSREKAGDRLMKKMEKLIAVICEKVKIPFSEVRIEYGLIQ